VIAILATPAGAMLALELADAAVNFFAHANVGLPGPLEKLLRRLVITPDMHRIHHSEDVADRNRNFGVVFPWWDRSFGTYLAEPAAGQDGMATGLKEAGGERTGLLGMLVDPFHP
jgi:sterol desaturase/sphingolipid hydroxylase (fatty acid hydroxylase superfamily)